MKTLEQLQKDLVRYSLGEQLNHAHGNKRAFERYQKLADDTFKLIRQRTQEIQNA